MNVALGRQLKDVSPPAKECYQFRGTSSDSFDAEGAGKQGCTVREVDRMLHPQSRRNADDNRAAAVLDFAAEFVDSCLSAKVNAKIGGRANEGENKLHLGGQAVVDHISGSLEPERSTTDQPYNDQCTQRLCGAQTSQTPCRRCSNHSSSAKPTERG